MGQTVHIRKRVGNTMKAVNSRIELLFDGSPVMMHSVDKDLRIVRVNRRWLQRMGYARREVMGKKSVEFLTEESRERALQDALPIFWRVGSARSIGFQFVTQKGRVLDVLLDADVCPSNIGGLQHYAALSEGHDITQWQRSCATLGALQQFTRLRGELEAALLGNGDSDPGTGLPMESGHHAGLLEEGLMEEAFGSALELVGDMSMDLRALTRVHEEWLTTMVELQEELVPLGKSIAKSVAEIADAMSTTPQESE